MNDYNRIREACKQAEKALAMRVDSQIEQAFETLIRVFDEEIPQGEVLSPEAMIVQFEVVSTMIDYHIQKGIMLDIGGHSIQMIEQFEGVKASGIYSDDDLSRMEKIVIGAIHKSRDYVAKVANPPTSSVKFDRGGKCRLCKKNPADAIGSHLVPHMLIQTVFSYDNTKGRDKEVAESFNLSGGEYGSFFGRNVNDEVMSDINNRPVSDEEVEYEGSKHNLFTRDHVFCQDCEKRFSAVESFYSEVLNGKARSYPPAIPYLFWVSVFWRMSIGNMGIKLHPKDEERLRRILDCTLSKDREKIQVDPKSLGGCAYGIYHCEDIKDETTGIMGMHRYTIPYKVLIGNDYINFFIKRNDAVEFNKRHGDSPDSFNDGTKPEQRTEIPFISFWLAKRAILDENYVFDLVLDRKGIRPPETITRYIDKDKDLYAGYEGRYVSDTGLSSDMLKGDKMPIVPRAVMKIMKYIDKHPKTSSYEGMTEDEKVQAEREAITKSTGYSIEEIEVIMSYWEQTSQGLKKNHRNWTFENV